MKTIMKFIISFLNKRSKIYNKNIIEGYTPFSNIKDPKPPGDE